MTDRAAGPLISVVTAALNSLPGLQRTVASVAAQTFTDYEHIVVDGGSSDGTREWLEENGSGLRWMSEPDEGIADALNKGVAMSVGEWILVLQSEDTLLRSDSLATASDWLDSGTDVVCFDVLFLGPKGSRRLVSRGFSIRLNTKPFPHQGAFTSSRLIERVGGFDTGLQLHMDYEFYLRAYRQGARSMATYELLSCMPDTGVTSRLDWPSLRDRFAEERQIHRRHAITACHRLFYWLYWPPYLVYRRVRALGFRPKVPSAGVGIGRGSTGRD